MKLGMKLVMFWVVAVAFGGASAGTMIAANNANMTYQQVASNN